MFAVDRQSLVRTLIEDPSEVNRSRAHAALGKLALSQDRPARAAIHFQEALELDPTDEITAEALASLQPRSPAKRRWWARA